MTFWFSESKVSIVTVCKYAIWCPDYVVDTLQLIQNQAVWATTNQERSNHITETLIMLHWLSVKYRMEYKKLHFAYKHDTVPVYLTDMLFPYVPSRTVRSEQNSE